MHIAFYFFCLMSCLAFLSQAGQCYALEHLHQNIYRNSTHAILRPYINTYKRDEQDPNMFVELHFAISVTVYIRKPNIDMLVQYVDMHTELVRLIFVQGALVNGSIVYSPNDIETNCEKIQEFYDSMEEKSSFLKRQINLIQDSSSVSSRRNLPILLNKQTCWERSFAYIRDQMKYNRFFPACQPR